MMFGFYPTEAQRYAAHCKHEHEMLKVELGGRLAPSLEVLIEEARRHPTRDLLTVIRAHRVARR